MLSKNFCRLDLQIPFDIGELYRILGPEMTITRTRLHSYFEDGSDPDERLQLPESIMQILAR